MTKLTEPTAIGYQLPAKMRLVFLGTPEFAVASLQALLEAGFNVVGVVTAPDKPAGRGRKTGESAIKTFALEKGIQVLQPEKLKSDEFTRELAALKADLQVVVAFRMLPEVVWNMPRYGTINLHASLLPKYRGAAPINHAIMNGETESGVTTFFLKHEIDTGNLLFSERVSIGKTETAGELHDVLMNTGAKLLVKTVAAIESNKYSEIPQEKVSGNAALPHAPKIFPQDCRINWSLPVKQVYDHIRGLSPHPGAYTLLNGKNFKIYQGHLTAKNSGIQTGEFSTDHKSFLHFACADGMLAATDVQMEGKKRMAVADFLRGTQV